jgi:hypothetical protein
MRSFLNLEANISWGGYEQTHTLYNITNREIRQMCKKCASGHDIASTELKFCTMCHRLLSLTAEEWTLPPFVWEA